MHTHFIIIGRYNTPLGIVKRNPEQEKPENIKDLQQRVTAAIQHHYRGVFKELTVSFADTWHGTISTVTMEGSFKSKEKFTLNTATEF